MEKSEREVPPTIQFKAQEGNSISVYQIQMPVAK
jgi:hypothetical protein